MCGITGVIVKNNPEKATEIYYKLLQFSDIRGQDGTGLTILRDKEFLTQRWNQRARNITDFPKLELNDKVVGQNRYAIFGLSHINDQPIIGKDFALVHNGVLYHYEKQFQEQNFKRELKVDTELILRLLEFNFLPYAPTISLKNVLNGFEGEGACLILTKTEIPFMAFMKNKILYSGEDEFGNIYFFSTVYIKNKVPEIYKNIKEFQNRDIEIIY